MNAQTLLPGFDNPVMQSQQTFRKVLEAMSHPGRIVTCNDAPEGPEALSPAATAVCLALTDFETPIWLDSKAQAAADYLKFHCSCPVTELSTAATFAVIAATKDLDNFEQFNLGTNDYPDRAATLILEVKQLSNKPGKTLRGPGIQNSLSLAVEGVNKNFWQQIHDNNSLFPRGVDLILTCDRQLAALPRTTLVEL